MSKRKPQRRSHAPRRGKRPSRDLASLGIPIIVGLIVIAIVVGVIFSIENQQPAAASLPGGVSVPDDTAQSLSTRSIPYPDVPRISLQDAWDRLEQDQAILVDVRSRASFDKVHAAGALSLPEEEVGALLDELPREKDWILY
jgi:hypothetical protein